MSPTDSDVHLSGIDEDRFGVRTARAPGVTRESLPAIMSFCRANSVTLLITRCPASEIGAAQLMEESGFLLMDTLVCYERNIARKPIPRDVAKVATRPLGPGEDEKVRAIAAESFRGYFGHYHADQRLNRTKCDAVYASWALRLCVSRDVANEVVVADSQGRIVGFSGLRLTSAEVGENVLLGVSPSAQRQGVFRSLLVAGMEWCHAHGAVRMLYTTQMTNVAVQKGLVQLGFEPNRGYYTFHKWFQ